MTKVKVKITATVETTVLLAEGETKEQLIKRDVDIYLHGAGEDGHFNKEDLGCNTSEIEILEDGDTCATVYADPIRTALVNLLDAISYNVDNGQVTLQYISEEIETAKSLIQK